MPASGSSHLDGHAQIANPDERDANSQTPLLKRFVPKPATASKRVSLLFQDWWLWEIVSAIVAVLAILVIIVILVAFDQSSLPDWPSVFTVRSIYILYSSILLKNCIDKLSHLFLCRNSEAFHHVGGWGLDLAVQMVMVPPGRASPSERSSNFRRCQSGAMGSSELVDDYQSKVGVHESCFH